MALLGLPFPRINSLLDSERNWEWLKNLKLEKADLADEVGGWSDYTPVWTAASSNPAIGNGTIAGRYTQLGKTVHARIAVTMGGTTTFGTGIYSFSLPVTCAFSGFQAIGYGTALDTGTEVYGGIVCPTTTTTAQLAVPVAAYPSAEPSRVISPTVPFTFASTDQIHLSMTYEAA